MQSIRILFVCAGPGVRARIAEAFMRDLPGVEAASAQFENREGKIPPFITQLMDEVGTRIGGTFPMSVFERFRNKEPFDYVITLCHASSKVVCPIFRVNIDKLYEEEAGRLSWSIRDFRSIDAGSPEERRAQARIIRDEIRQNVETFARALAAQKNQLAT